MINLLIQQIKTYNYLGVTEIDADFYEAYYQRTNIFDAAEKEIGHLPLFQTIKILCTTEKVLVCEKLAKIGDLYGLMFAHKLKLWWHHWTCTYAAENGHLDCLVYLHENGCPWDKPVCLCAARNGQLDCLVYANENGCPRDEGVCGFAAQYGHLDCLVYAHKNIHPVNKPYWLHNTKHQHIKDYLNTLP